MRSSRRSKNTWKNDVLTASFIFAKGLSEELERALWAKGIISWEILRQYSDEAVAILGNSRTQKLVEQVAEAQDALTRNDAAWFKANWPERESWRLWKGYADPERTAFVDIETTGLTPGYDQITVIGLADGAKATAFVAGRPQAGDEPIERFREAIKAYQLIVTYNGTSFDLPFIEKSFREANFKFALPHLDVMLPARTIGLQGGLKDMEKQVGIVRPSDIKDMRGVEAIQLWGQWKNAGDMAAYRRLTTYCKADCTNLREFTELVYAKRWNTVYTPYARQVDFAKIKGQQLSIF
jgi:uncharacterized protein YprB with RNaseH-like and TPR domain